MKKKLLALAVAGAFVAPAAMADTANVNVYGVINMSFDSTSTGSGSTGINGLAPATQSASQTKVSSNASRIGFKGSEDLGGMSAIWQVETQLHPDNSTTNATTLANRNSFLGLSGDSWGTVLLGRNDSPYKTSTRKLDLFGDTVADNRSLMGGAGLSATQLAAAIAVAAGTATAAQTTTNNGIAGSTTAMVGFDNRPGDVVQYNSPNMSGFSASVQYVAGAEAAPNTGTKGNAYSLSGTYEAGPIYAALAYQSNKFGALGSGTMGGTVATTDNTESAWKLGGSYTMDQIQVLAVYERTRDDLNKGVAGQDSDLLGHHTWYIGGKFNISGSDAVKLSYTKMNDLNMGGVAGAKQNTGAKQISIGYDHAMSKRTTVYALYTKLDNDSAARYNLSSAAGISTANVAPSGYSADPTAFSVGIKHSF